MSHTRARLERRTAHALNALQQSALLGRASPHQLMHLLAGADLVALRAGDVLYPRGSDAEACHVLMDGRLSARVPHDDGRVAHVAELSPVCLFGETEMFTGRPHPVTLVATTDAALLRIRWSSIDALMRRSASFRRALQMTEAEHALVDALTDAERHSAERIVLLCEDPALAPRLLARLGEAIALDFDDRVALLRVRPDAAGPEIQRRAERGPVTVFDVTPDAHLLYDARAYARVATRFDYLLVDTSEAGAEAATLHRGYAHKVLRLYRHRPPELGMIPAAAEVIDAVCLPDDGWGRPRPDLPPAAIRLATSPEAMARGASVLVIEEAAQAALSRWARGATDRNVGLALGGGGAWGFAHVALIEALAAAEVPLDMIAGSSIGAVVGAFYCVAGLDGLRRLVALGPRLRRVVLASIIDSRRLQRFVAAELGRPWLEDLATPLLPVTTEIAQGRGAVLRGLRLDEGVRASAAFPGAMTPTTRLLPDGAFTRLVDGGVSQTVPDQALVDARMDFVIASNAIPPPQVMPVRRPLLPGGAGRWLHEFNPLWRLEDAARSAFILMHQAGELDANCSDVVFTAAHTRHMPLDFDHSAAVVDAARPSAEALAAEIARRWRLRRGTRG
ncbi:MAG: cyclic nucleotide-binding domain-containing protein [Myxococcales bacterium]|nr:cyclic nucleotide-binding domain-containing protein [Myxococcales bacterium]